MEDIYDIDDHIVKKDGSQCYFTNPWVLWYQDNRSNTYAFAPLCKFRSIAGFWTLMNNIKYTQNVRLVFMREGIKPEWEDPRHISGAQCVIEITKWENANSILLNCLIGIVSETFTINEYDSLNITGVTYINDSVFKQIRIWLSDGSEYLGVNEVSLEYQNLLIVRGVSMNSFKYTTFDKLKNKNSKKGKKKRPIQVPNGAPFHEKNLIV